MLNVALLILVACLLPSCRKTHWAAGEMATELGYLGRGVVAPRRATAMDCGKLQDLPTDSVRFDISTEGYDAYVGRGCVLAFENDKASASAQARYRRTEVRWIFAKANVLVWLPDDTPPAVAAKFEEVLPKIWGGE